jgi:hypothetical protein
MSMILDGHTHVYPEEVCRRREDFFADEPGFRLLYDSPKAKLVGPEEMVAALEEAGVEAAVLMGFPWRQERLWRRQHEVILEAMRRFPKTLIGFCAVNILEPGAPREVERCLAAGFRGVGELAWYETDLGEDLTALLAPLAELCQHYRVPLLIHTSTGRKFTGWPRKWWARRRSSSAATTPCCPSAATWRKSTRPACRKTGGRCCWGEI